MAKRKLSSEQRAELRVELKKAMGGSQKTADVLRDVAKKYGITTITARWYLKSIGIKPKKARGGAKRGRKPGRPAGGGGDAGLLKLVEERDRSAKEVRKLVPRWQRLVSREASLRQLASRVQRKLSATSKRAVALRKRIDVLVGS